MPCYTMENVSLQYFNALRNDPQLAIDTLVMLANKLATMAGVYENNPPTPTEEVEECLATMRYFFLRSFPRFSSSLRNVPLNKDAFRAWALAQPSLPPAPTPFTFAITDEVCEPPSTTNYKVWIGAGLLAALGFYAYKKRNEALERNERILPVE